MLRRLAIAVVLVVTPAAAAVAAATSEQPRPAVPKAAGSPVTPAAKEAIHDWYDDGEFQRDHSCMTIENALNALPGSLDYYERVVAEFRAYRTTVC